MLSAFHISYGISQLPAGWLADRIGPRILITIGISGVAIAGFLVGLSPNHIMVIIFLVLMGVLGSGYHPASAPLISASVEPKNQGRALGLHITGEYVAFFLAPLMAAAIALAWGWRAPFIILAIPTFLFGIVFYMLMGRRSPIKQAERQTTSNYTETPPTPGRSRRLVTLFILVTSVQATIFAVIAFIPLYLVDYFGIGKETAAAFISLFYSAGLWASPLGGYLSDRLGRIPVLLATCLMAGPVILLLNLAPYGFGTGAILVIIGMAAYAAQPISVAYIVSNTPERHRSSILGIYFFGNMEGAGVLTLLMGNLIEHFGFHLSFTIAGAAMLGIAATCSMLLWGSRDQPVGINQ